MESLGQTAYEAYGEQVNWQAYNGAKMPSWDNLPNKIKAAWEVAAEAVAQAC